VRGIGTTKTEGLKMIEDLNSKLEGRVTWHDGSGRTVNFNLGEGNTKLRIVINENKKIPDSRSEFSALVGNPSFRLGCAF
jgi:hypothetical protein